MANAVPSDAEFIDELADVVRDQQEAETLALAAGFPSRHLPAFHSSKVFWSKIVNRLRHGIVVDGMRKLAERAHEDYPGNRIFNDFVDQLSEAEDVVPSDHVSLNELRHYLGKLDALYRHLHLAGFETKVRVPIALDDLHVPLDASVERSSIRHQVFHYGDDAEGHDDAQIPLARAFEVARRRTQRGVVLLGDPGSGKTTHLKQVLLQVARAGSQSIGLPPDVVPVFLPLRRLRDLEAGLGSFIQQELTDPLLDVAPDFGERLCKRGKLLLLFDGLDEVARVEDRVRVAKWIQHARRAAADNHFLVSCRFSGYSVDTQLDEHFLELHLRPMSGEQVETFVRKWYRIVEHATNEDEDIADKRAVEGAARLLATLKEPKMASARVYTMTHNPLLLTTICLVHRDRGELPDKRVVLYEEAVSVLLERWRRVTKDLPVQFPKREALQVLQPVAWWMHQASGRVRASAAELEEPVTEGLAVIDRADVGARRFLEAIRDESGLLTGWGTDEFGFMHLGFQEYLAAMAVSAWALDRPQLLTELAGRFDDSWWQEVILLMLAQDRPPMFKRFMAEVVKRDEFSKWAKSEMMGLCWNEAFGISKEPFVALLREEGAGEGLGARQLAAAELLSRRMPKVLEGIEQVLREHPAEVVREWWSKRRVVDLVGVGESTTEATARLTVTRAAPRGGVELVRIPAGKFLMGSPEDEEGRFDREGPQHEVVLSGFYLARTQVTNAQYRQYLEDNPGVKAPKHWGDRRYNQDDQPVVGVSWEDAQAYCEWAGLSLPTEAQWEYACRAGTTTRYHSGDREGDLARVGWYRKNSGGRLHSVGELEPNDWGLYDMHGNVFEWCQDDWVGHYRGADHQPGDGLRIKPVGDGDRVIRGGGFDGDARDARSAFRLYGPPDSRYDDLGFRPAQGIALQP